MSEIKPGVAVVFQMRQKGVVSRKRGKYWEIRVSSKFWINVPEEDILEVLDPTPDPLDVISSVPCTWCGALTGDKCLDMRYAEDKFTIKHPHGERVKDYLEKVPR